MSSNPYAPPNAEVGDVVLGEVAPALWNPGAAAYWSLLLSPAFGAFLHMKNWQALGDTGKAGTARIWAVASIVAILCFTGVTAFLPESKPLDALSRVFGIVLLLCWYYSSGKDQVGLVKARFGKSYPRRGWTQPLALAVAALVAFVVVVVAFSIAVGVA